MAVITLRVLDGADRGKVYENLLTPVTIGREEGNTVQLNDERISRYHIKIQEDQDKIVLTDLESTNGSRVNGEDAQLRILRFGDVVQVGRSVLLYGTRGQIAERLEGLRANGLCPPEELEFDNLSKTSEGSSSVSFESEWNKQENLRSTLHIPEPPELPTGLSPGQAAQVSEILEFLHLRSRSLVQSVRIPEDSQAEIVLDYEQWQDLLDLQSLLAEYLRKIGDPGEG